MEWFLILLGLVTMIYPYFPTHLPYFGDEEPHPWQRHVVAHYGGSFSQCGNLKWAIDKDLWICHEYHGMMLSYVINPIESIGPEWNHFCCCPSKFWGVLGHALPVKLLQGLNFHGFWPVLSPSPRSTELGHQFSPLFVRWNICWYSKLAREKSTFYRLFSLDVFRLRMSMSQATSLMGGKLATFGFGCQSPWTPWRAIITHQHITRKLMESWSVLGEARDELHLDELTAPFLFAGPKQVRHWLSWRQMTRPSGQRRCAFPRNSMQRVRHRLCQTRVEQPTRMVIV